MWNNFTERIGTANQEAKEPYNQLAAPQNVHPRIEDGVDRGESDGMHVVDPIRVWFPKHFQKNTNLSKVKIGIQLDMK